MEVAPFDYLCVMAPAGSGIAYLVPDPYGPQDVRVYVGVPQPGDTFTYGWMRWERPAWTVYLCTIYRTWAEYADPFNSPQACWDYYGWDWQHWGELPFVKQPVPVR